jgi:hypothetical protein
MKVVFALLCILCGILLYIFGIGFVVTLVGAFISLMSPTLIDVSFWLPLKMGACWTLSFLLAILSAAFLD